MCPTLLMIMYDNSLIVRLKLLQRRRYRCAAIAFASDAPSGVTLTGLCLFMWSFSLGMGALTFLIAAEVREGQLCDSLLPYAVKGVPREGKILTLPCLPCRAPFVRRTNFSPEQLVQDTTAKWTIVACARWTRASC